MKREFYSIEKRFRKSQSVRLWEKRGLKAAKSQKQSNMISSSSIAYHHYSPKTCCFLSVEIQFSIVGSVSARMLKVLGSFPGQSINPFCRCPHFLRESDRASRLSGFSGALAKKMKTRTKGIYGLTGDRAWYFQLTKLTSYRLSHTGF